MAEQLHTSVKSTVLESYIRCESHLIRSNLPTDLLFKLWNGFFVFNVNYLLQNTYIAITQVPFSKWISNSSYTSLYATIISPCTESQLLKNMPFSTLYFQVDLKATENGMFFHKTVGLKIPQVHIKERSM